MDTKIEIRELWRQKPLASWVPGERLFWHLHKLLIQAGTATLCVGWSCPRGRGRAPPSPLTHSSPLHSSQWDGHSDAPRSLAQRLQETKVLGLTSKHPITNRCGKALFYFRLKEFSPLMSCSANSAERETEGFSELELHRYHDALGCLCPRPGLLELTRVSIASGRCFEVKWKLLSHVWLFAISWTTARRIPLSMRFPRPRILEWVAISFSRAIPNPRIELRSPALQAYSLPSEPPEKSRFLSSGICYYWDVINNLFAVHNGISKSYFRCGWNNGITGMCPLTQGDCFWRNSAHLGIFSCWNNLPLLILTHSLLLSIDQGSAASQKNWVNAQVCQHVTGFVNGLHLL